jgi:hypothetical protein
MAAPDKFEDLHLSDLSLEPMPDPNVMNYQPPKVPVEEKAAFHAETRSKKVTDRRINPDRRKVLRFEPDRRSGKDRRPRKSWEPGKNI